MPTTSPLPFVIISRFGIVVGLLPVVVVVGVDADVNEIDVCVEYDVGFVISFISSKLVIVLLGTLTIEPVVTRVLSLHAGAVTALSGKAGDMAEPVVAGLSFEAVASVVGFFAVVIFVGSSFEAVVAVVGLFAVVIDVGSSFAVVCVFVTVTVSAS